MYAKGSVQSSHRALSTNLPAMLAHFDAKSGSVTFGHTVAGRTSKVVITDLRPEIFSVMDEWMYRTCQRNLCLYQAMQLFVARDKYGVTSLHSQCPQSLKYSIEQLYPGEGFGEIADLQEFATIIGSSTVAEVSLCP